MIRKRTFLLILLNIVLVPLFPSEVKKEAKAFEPGLSERKEGGSLLEAVLTVVPVFNGNCVYLNNLTDGSEYKDGGLGSKIYNHNALIREQSILKQNRLDGPVSKKVQENLKEVVRQNRFDIAKDMDKHGYVICQDVVSSDKSHKKFSAIVIGTDLEKCALLEKILHK